MDNVGLCMIYLNVLYMIMLVVYEIWGDVRCDYCLFLN